MNRAMISSSVTMGQLQKKMDTISSNIANVNTAGFKSRNVEFSSLLFQQMNNLPGETNETGRQTPVGIRAGTGAKIAGTNVNLDLGNIKQTGRPLDLALSVPNHFFEIASESGNGDLVQRFTRDGAFYLSPVENDPSVLNLVTKEGAYVLGDEGRIQIPAYFESMAINERGTIRVTLENGNEVTVDRLALAEVMRPELLKSTGDNSWTFPNLAELNLAEADVVQAAALDNAGIQQGALEMSNVDLGTEMTELIEVQRSYQMNARAFTVANDAANLVNNIR